VLLESSQSPPRHRLALCQDGHRYTADFETSSLGIDAKLIPYLEDLSRSLAPPETVQRALNCGFQTDADVANAYRDQVRREREIDSLDRLLNQDEENVQTLLDVLPDEPDSRGYDDAVELITVERTEIEEVLGEKGWEVLLVTTELEDEGLLPRTERDLERVLTALLEVTYGVNERQASTHKKRLREAARAAVKAGNPIFERLGHLLRRKKT
jgi:hypothetical protein